MIDEQPFNPRAFPISMTEESIDNLGMTLRDYFAARALRWSLETVSENCERGTPNNTVIAAAAHGAYRIADAMLAERAKK